MRIVVLSEVTRLTELEDAWEGLARRCSSNLFSSHQWCVAGLKAFFPESDIKTFLFYDSERLVGILPLCRSVQRFVRMPARTYHSSDDPLALTTPLIEPEYLREALGCVWSSARTQLGSHDILKLTVSDDQKTAVHQSLESGGRGRRGILFTEKEVLRLEADSREELWNGVLSKRRRQDHRKMQRTFDKLNCEIDFPEPSEVAADPDRYWARFLGIIARSWKPSYPRSEFWQSLYRTYAGRGRLLISFLRSGQKDIASWWWIAHGPVVHAIQTVFDNDYGKYSPGTYLLECHLLRLLDEGHRSFDFMGSESYKSIVSNDQTKYYSLYVFDRGIYANVLQRLARYSKLTFQSGSPSPGGGAEIAKAASS